MPRGSAPTTPPRFPETPPSTFPSAEYSYILELVSTIQHELGKLSEAVDSLKNQSKDESRELRDIAKDVHGFKIGLKVGVTILSAVFAVSTGIIVFILNHLTGIVQAYFAIKK